MWLVVAFLCAGAADHYESGMALARSGRLEEARQALIEGQRAAPGDKRFPLELAGIAYRDHDVAAARNALQRALRLDPEDRYGNDFLGTLYFLDGNLEAALKYWNRVGKPFVEEVRFEPEPRLDPVLLARLPAFSGGAVLSGEDVAATRARLEALGVRRSRIELSAKPERRFDVAVSVLERPRWNSPPALLRGVAMQTAHFDGFNVRGSGANWTSLLRWDAQKRRVASTYEAPLGRDPDRRYALWADVRREVWNTGDPEDFRLRKAESGVELRFLSGARLEWRGGLRLAHREFSNAPELRGGTSVSYQTGVSYRLLAVPERRFSVDTGARWELARMVSGTGALFSRAQASVASKWLPRAKGDDYEVTTRVRAGKTLGRPPFDELFFLGVERDNDLWLRGHAGTRGGKKGAALRGREYVLLNWEMDKEIYRHGLFTVLGGPLVDAARISGQWLGDPGAQLKIRVLGAWTAALSYGRDLRSGRGVVYLAFVP